MTSAEMCSGLRLIDFVHHSTLGLRLIKKKKMGIIAPWVSESEKNVCRHARRVSHTRDMLQGYLEKGVQTPVARGRST